ncbi:electron transfer flavoprotein subunit YgcR [Escherichia coli]|uniref:Electron transfer flavoprotein subunit YgcR n=1 Tax=Escherichia coli TaxID=562 RepID=A0A2X1Q940_ECOLX|nr:electron transfer flavoprotein subunit YgcR [Escherichia coli]
MSLTALSMGDERALHWLRYLMALGFEEAVLLETAADLRFAPEFVARHIAEWQHQNPLDLIITGCQSSEGQNGQTPFLLAEMLAGPASPRWSVSLSTRCLSPSNSVLNMGCVVAGFACLR